MRLRLADSCSAASTPTPQLRALRPRHVTAQISDDLTAIATDIANGLRHFRAGNVEEALWWWQFSYLASWGNNACGVLSALHSVVAHDRLDRDVDERGASSRGGGRPCWTRAGTLGGEPP